MQSHASDDSQVDLSDRFVGGGGAFLFVVGRGGVLLELTTKWFCFFVKQQNALCILYRRVSKQAGSTWYSSRLLIVQ